MAYIISLLTRYSILWQDKQTNKNSSYGILILSFFLSINRNHLFFVSMMANEHSGIDWAYHCVWHLVWCTYIFQFHRIKNDYESLWKFFVFHVITSGKLKINEQQSIIIIITILLYISISNIGNIYKEQI